jgi:hypothetical protein
MIMCTHARMHKYSYDDVHTYTRSQTWKYVLKFASHFVQAFNHLDLFQNILNYC